jgi:glycerol-3-phosphate acyltransferase PlsX
MRIALDAMGGDNAPYEIVWGGLQAAAETDDDIILVGDEAAIRDAMKMKHPKIRPLPDAEALLNAGRVRIVHTEESVAMDDAPAAAVRRKKNCSINLCMRMVKDGEADAAVSAGNSGAMAASALFILGRIKGVARPAIATVMPTADADRPLLLLDAGANTDCHHEWLREFAVMGDVYSRLVLGRENPEVGLMSIGTEDCKGNELTKHAFPILRDYTPGLNFKGNVEGHDVFEGQTDVIVCDGFVGNVILKTSESAAHAMGGWLKRIIKSRLAYKLAALMLLPALKKFKQQMDPEVYGGAPLLGVPGAVIITHGSSSYKAIFYACRAGSRAAAHNLSKAIEARIAELPGVPLEHEGNDPTVA